MTKFFLFNHLMLFPVRLLTILRGKCTTAFQTQQTVASSSSRSSRSSRHRRGHSSSSGSAPKALLWEDIWSKVVGTSSPPTDPLLTTESRGRALLRRLNMTSSLEPKPFSIESSALLDVLGCSIPAVFRLGTGAFAEGYKLEIGEKDSTKYTIFQAGNKQIVESSQLMQPNRMNAINNSPLILYDQEGSASCRLVREACSILSLEVLIRPCPENGLQFASGLGRDGQLANLPILDDPNTGIVGFKKDTMAILTYLFKTYGNGELPWTMKKEGFCRVSALLAMASRLGSGSQYHTSDPPTLPLILWSYESSPFCKRVTERLGSLELQHKVIYCPRGSPNRQRLFDLTGRFQVPYLQDPNTDVNLWESSAICLVNIFFRTYKNNTNIRVWLRLV